MGSWRTTRCCGFSFANLYDMPVHACMICIFDKNQHRFLPPRTSELKISRLSMFWIDKVAVHIDLKEHNFGNHPPSTLNMLDYVNLGSSQLKSASSVPIIWVQCKCKYMFVSKNHTWKASSSYFKQSGHFLLFRDPYQSLKNLRLNQESSLLGRWS